MNTISRRIWVAVFLFGLLLGLLTLGLALWLHCQATPRLIHTEPSQFSPVVVYEQAGARCMAFESIHAPGRQTCVGLDEPDKMRFEYTRMMMSALFAKPDPQSILLIGLGGGTLPRALHTLLPKATIDTVELDPAVA